MMLSNHEIQIQALTDYAQNLSMRLESVLYENTKLREKRDILKQEHYVQLHLERDAVRKLVYQLEKERKEHFNLIIENTKLRKAQKLFLGFDSRSVLIKGVVA